MALGLDPRAWKGLKPSDHPEKNPKPPKPHLTEDVASWGSRGHLSM